MDATYTPSSWSYHQIYDTGLYSNINIDSNYIYNNYWSGQTASIIPALEAVAKNYIYSDLTAGDMVCAFYTPDGLPQGYTMTVDGFLGNPSTEYEFRVYLMTHFSNTCDDVSQIIFNHCDDINNLCTNYVNSMYTTNSNVNADNSALDIQQIVYDPNGYVDTSGCGGCNGKGIGLTRSASFSSSFQLNGKVKNIYLDNNQLSKYWKRLCRYYKKQHQQLCSKSPL
jgi:hypothetical protein